MTTYVKSLSLFTIYPIYKFMNTKKNINIVLDMDETLLHTCRKDKFFDHNNSNTNKKFVESETHIIFTRPFLNSFLFLTSKIGNIYLMTKGTKKYAESVITTLQIDKYFIEKKYREDLTSDCKDLKILLSNTELSNSILVDDKKSNQCINQELYHIPKYNMYVKYDFELVKLFFYLLYKS
jgi:TFIIF-interacting CTD phosphatase-like protein